VKINNITIFFEIFIQLMILISLVAFSIETLPDLDESTYIILNRIEFIITIIFSIEYIVRVVSSKNKLSYIFSFYGAIDLLSILPFYLSGSISLQSLRVLRFMRIFRILKLARYNGALRRIGKSISLSKEELILFSIITLILLYLSSLGIYYFEHVAQPENFKSIFDCLWWSVATLTTVGYGDIYPITLGGRLFTFVILMLGLGIVAVPTGIVASALYSVRKEESVSKDK